MKNIVYATILFLAFFTTQTKAEPFVKFNPDSIPSKYVKIRQYNQKPKQYLLAWNEMKRKIEAKQGDKTLDLYFLYRERHNFHYQNNNVDSLRKYTPILKELCLKLNDFYFYYRSWDLLCEALLFSNNIEEEKAEHQKMYNDALQRNSEIGMAYYTGRIGMGYATRREYAKAKPYIAQAMKLFEKIKCWNEYITITSNYIIILNNLGQKQESLQAFQHLDSLANSFIKANKVTSNAARIMMIKDMASEIYTEPKDTVILKKYMKEMDEIYQKAPNISPIYNFNTKKKYAGLRNNLSEEIAYQDSSARYYHQNNNMINLSITYHSMAKNLYEAKRYEEAYLTLHKHVSLNDSINKKEFQQQLNEMSTRYNLNKLELDTQKAIMKARNTQYYYACALIIILTITLIIGIKFYMHKFKSNRLLKKQAQDLKLANEKVLNAQLMKTAFIQNMNHEVRTPLNAIVGFSECLAEIQMEPEDVKEVSLAIKKNSDKLLKIVNDMISISNFDSNITDPVYQEFSVDAHCTDLIQIMQEYVQPSVNLYYTPCNTDYILKSDRDIIHQILTNLLHNALKFTESGEVELSYQIDYDKKELRFYIRDTGPGVSSDLKEKIFERFYKVNSFVPGTGLGLALCRVLAERLKAQVYMEDSYQRGCLFVFAHPLPDK